MTIMANQKAAKKMSNLKQEEQFARPHKPRQQARQRPHSDSQYVRINGRTVLIEDAGDNLAEDELMD